MASLNKVILMGNMCADPELKQTPSGVTVCTFRLAVQRRQKDGDGNYLADFIPCVAWRQTAEFVCRYFKKGTAAVVCGVLQSRSYTDAAGNKRYVLEVTADEVGFGASRGGGASVPMPSDGDAPLVRGSVVEHAPTFEPLEANEDLPF